MHTRETVNEALALASEGANASEIARRLNIPRTTVRDWLRGHTPKRIARINSGATFCLRCGHARHRFRELPPAYVYLLGLYLGDGCISEHRRGVYKLRLFLDEKYPGIVTSAREAMQAVRCGGAGTVTRPQHCIEVYESWPCLFPQHGPGRKHSRTIVLTDWQNRLVEHWPDELLRGLIHSDGCRFQNTGTNWTCPRYSFKQVSEDIRAIFCLACDLFGVRWTQARDTIYISRKADVARLDEFIGPKQ